MPAAAVLVVAGTEVLVTGFAVEVVGAAVLVGAGAALDELGAMDPLQLNTDGPVQYTVYFRQHNVEHRRPYLE